MSEYYNWIQAININIVEEENKLVKIHIDVKNTVIHNGDILNP